MVLMHEKRYGGIIYSIIGLSFYFFLVVIRHVIFLPEQPNSVEILLRMLIYNVLPLIIVASLSGVLTIAIRKRSIKPEAV
jgi:hypothetical protein